MKQFIMPVVLALAFILAGGCTLQSPSTVPEAQLPAGKVGRVEIRVTDAPRNDSITEIWIGVKSVEIHKADTDEESDGENGWTSANITGPNPFELLALKNGGIQEILGDIHLSTGNYTQIRLVVDNVTVTMNGENVTAEVPSGKIKFVHPFEVIDLTEGSTVLLFDFDAEKSVVTAGNSGKVLFKPVIKLTSEKPEKGKETLRIIPSGLPEGIVGVSYNSTLKAKGGIAPYTWNISAGYPTGLTFTNGTLSGIPEVADNFTFSVQLTDSSAELKTVNKEYTVEIVSP